jgi:endonuclease/exonuclease/phosphatase family metal-dependent hydrolase
MRIVSWNAKVGRPNDEFERDLRELIADQKPDVICLQEAGKYTQVLRNKFTDWNTYARQGWSESDMNPVMVKKKPLWRKRKRGKGWDTLRTKTVWEGPQGGEHTGRTWTWVQVGGMRIMSFHRCTGGKDKNKAAFVEEARVVTPWIESNVKPTFVFGDHNCGPRQDHKGASHNIAQAVNGRVLFDAADPGIDYAIADGVKGTVRHLNKKYGSDHRAVLFVKSK